jgi:hypothetical protein
VTAADICKVVTTADVVSFRYCLCCREAALHLLHIVLYDLVRYIVVLLLLLLVLLCAVDIKIVLLTLLRSAMSLQ